MTCSAARGLLPLFAGGDLTEGRLEEVRGHLASCADCTRELERFGEARALLEELRDDAALPKREVRRMWTTVRGEIPLLRVPRRLRFLATLRYAAIALVGLSIGFSATTLSARLLAPADEPAAPVASAPPQVPIQPVVIAGGAESPDRGRVQAATEQPGAAPVVRGPSTGITVTRLPVYEKSSAQLQAELNAVRQKNSELEQRIQTLERALKAKGE